AGDSITPEQNSRSSPSRCARGRPLPSSTHRSPSSTSITILPTDKPLNDARHAVVVTLSDLQALETNPAAQQEKIDKASNAIRSLVSLLKATQATKTPR